MVSRKLRLALALLLICPIFDATLRAQTCPLRAPQAIFPNVLTITGTGCGGGSVAPCLFNEPVTLAIPSAYTVQSCDTIQWTFGDGNEVVTTGSQSVSHTYTASGLYAAKANVSNSLGTVSYIASVAITATLGCPSTLTLYILILEFSAATCSSSVPNSACALGDPVAFTLRPWASWYPLEPCDTATIDFGDGVLSTLPSGVFTTTHTYTRPGSYSVTGNVTNVFGTYPISRTRLLAGNGTIGLYQESFQVVEGAVARFQVTRTSSAGSMSVNYATSDGTAIAGQDYVATAGTLTFASGETSKFIDVATIDNTRYKENEIFTVTLSSPSNDYILLLAQSSVTIVDDDIPKISFPQSKYVVRENSGQVTLTVSRAG